MLRLRQWSGVGEGWGGFSPQRFWLGVGLNVTAVHTVTLVLEKHMGGAMAANAE